MPAIWDPCDFWSGRYPIRFKMQWEEKIVASRITKGDALKSRCCVNVPFLKTATLVPPDWVGAEIYLFTNNGYWFSQAITGGTN